MACPFFMPVEQVQETGWIHAPRMPLGGRYRGWCKARPEETFEAEGDLCNCGYARGLCDRFPRSAEADAVRFSVAAEGPLKLVYIFERSHTPSSFGVLDLAAMPEDNVILAAQAHAFARERSLGATAGRQD